MDVKEAVKIAAEYVTNIFGPEDPTNIGLEEVTYDDMDHSWDVTIGFSRSWNYPKHPFSALQGVLPVREYKIVKIDDDSGEVKSIKIRETASNAKSAY